MAKTSNRQILLAARPNGMAKLSDFELVEKRIPSPKDGEVLFRNTLVSVDPYQRNLMGNGSSELPPIDVGTPMSGPTVAIVEESRNPAFAVGDHVQTWSGWQEHAVSDGSDLRKLDPNVAPISTALSVLGHTGLTAWVGMTKFMNPKPGGTLVVTAAAGAVGSLAAQIGKQRGLRVVGIAGGPDKAAYLKVELGLDATVDYKADDFEEQLSRALPNGIDAFYDNVGDYMFEAVMNAFNERAQIVIGGTIAGYSDTTMPKRSDHLPRLLNLFLYRFLQVQGFSVTNHLDCYPDFLAEVAPWVADGKVKYSEEFVDGFEKIPSTFFRLFDGSHRGKLIVRLGDAHDQ
ncbi:NADP-dependent oxidoreductase [Salinicola peritrichatus]|uniref:NADP-dependent oxidoreductase n=1 Tax=Salinicola peritrichatus TaxID=1267424 RepID=UPI000DA1576A|nr:NADP-dependent oxidoreductase [Salinicola peritrichatus]